MSSSEGHVRDQVAALKRRVLELESEVQRCAPYAQMAAGSRDPITLVDSECVHRQANGAYGRLVARDMSTIIGHSMAEVVGEEFFTSVMMPHLRRCFAGEASSIDVMHSLPDLGSRWFEIQFSPCRANDETVTVVALRLRDITRRKQAEEQLHEREARLEAIFHRSPVGIVLSRLADGRIIDVNPAFSQIYGYSRSEMVGRTSIELGLWAEPTERTAVTGSLMTEGPKRDLEIKARIKSQDIRDLRIAVDAFHFQGEVYALGLVQDITEHKTEIAERKRAEMALRKSEAQLRRILEVAPLPLCFVAKSGEITFRNERFLKLFGYTEEQVSTAAQWWQRAYPDPRYRERILESWSMAIQRASAEHRELEQVECEVTCSDGSVKTVDISGVPMDDGFLTTFADHTERRRAQERHEDLEAQLRASQKLEAVGTLAGGIAHDFNNLISVILNYTDFALDAGSGEMLHADLLEVKKASNRAAALTRQLLAFSRKQIMHPVTLDLNGVVAGIQSMFVRVLGEDIELHTALDPDLGVVFADPGQLEQVLTNLVINARDAMPNGGTCRITTRNTDFEELPVHHRFGVAPGAYVQLQVTDTGIGMDAYTQSRIFEPFFTTKTKDKGTGLGLSTTHGIVHQSGGTISVESQPGKGTTFTVTLPRQSTARVAATSERVRRSAGGSETVLVVEDEVALLHVLRRILESAGYRVLTAGNGDAALRLSETFTDEIHALVTDVVMPGMTGSRLAEDLRVSRPNVKVLFMSGYPEDAVSQHGVLEPGTWYVSKPFTADTLRAKLRSMLDAIQVMGASAT